jgi:hypothetical protein
LSATSFSILEAITLDVVDFIISIFSFSVIAGTNIRRHLKSVIRFNNNLTF